MDLNHPMRTETQQTLVDLVAEAVVDLVDLDHPTMMMKMVTVVVEVSEVEEVGLEATGVASTLQMMMSQEDSAEEVVEGSAATEEDSIPLMMLIMTTMMILGDLVAGGAEEEEEGLVHQMTMMILEALAEEVVVVLEEEEEALVHQMTMMTKTQEALAVEEAGVVLEEEALAPTAMMEKRTLVEDLGQDEVLVVGLKHPMMTLKGLVAKEEVALVGLEEQVIMMMVNRVAVEGVAAAVEGAEVVPQAAMMVTLIPQNSVRLYSCICKFTLSQSCRF